MRRRLTACASIASTAARLDQHSTRCRNAEAEGKLLQLLGNYLSPSKARQLACDPSIASQTGVDDRHPVQYMYIAVENSSRSLQEFTQKHSLVERLQKPTHFQAKQSRTFCVGRHWHWHHEQRGSMACPGAIWPGGLH